MTPTTRWAKATDTLPPDAARATRSEVAEAARSAVSPVARQWRDRRRKAKSSVLASRRRARDDARRSSRGLLARDDRSILGKSNGRASGPLPDVRRNAPGRNAGASNIDGTSRELRSRASRRHREEDRLNSFAARPGGEVCEGRTHRESLNFAGSKWGAALEPRLAKSGDFSTCSTFPPKNTRWEGV